MNVIKVKWFLTVPLFCFIILFLAYLQLLIEEHFLRHHKSYRHFKKYKEHSPHDKLIPEHIENLVNEAKSNTKSNSGSGEIFDNIKVEDYALIDGFDIYYRAVIPSVARFDEASHLIEPGFSLSKLGALTNLDLGLKDSTGSSTSQQMNDQMNDDGISKELQQISKFSRVIVLLHGMRFSSQTWADIKTMDYIANKTGYPSVAIDLPGYGRSRSLARNIKPRSTELTETEIIKFMEQVPIVLGFPFSKVILVAPSMAGIYSFPWLIDTYNNKIQKVQFEGFIPIAPVGIEEHIRDLYKIQVPTMIVYGELDEIGSTTSKVLKRNLPDWREIKISGGDHACYIESSELFNLELVNFIEYLVMKARRVFHVMQHH